MMFIKPEKNRLKDFIITSRKYYLDDYFNEYTKVAKNDIQFFVTDMWDSYIVLAKKHFPQAKIIVDRFHLIKLVSTAINAIRNEVQKKYSINSREYKLLYKSRNLLRKNYDNVNRLEFKYKKYRAYIGINTDFEALKECLSYSKDLELMYYLYQDVLNIFNDNDVAAFRKLLNNKEYRTTKRTKSILKNIYKISRVYY